MSPSQAIARREAREELARFDDEQIALIKNTIAKGATDNELKLFIYQCERTGLDPFARQIYSIKRGNERQVQVSIDGARLIAERSGRYWPGRTFYYDADGNEQTVWLKDEPPAAARVTVFKDGHEVPGVPVRFKERFQSTATWKSMPATMIAKCAEMATLRQAFPQELSGLYSTDEMGSVPPTGYVEGQHYHREEAPALEAGEEHPFEGSEPEEEERASAFAQGSDAPASTATAQFGADGEQSPGSEQTSIFRQYPSTPEQEAAAGVDIFGEPEPLPQSAQSAEASTASSPPDASASPADPIVQQAGEIVAPPESTHAGQTIAEIVAESPEWGVWVSRNEDIEARFRAAVSTYMWAVHPDLMEAK